MIKLFPFLFTVICSVFFAAMSHAQEPLIRLSSEQAQDLEIEEINPGTYQITTTGTDPYLFTYPLDAALEEGNIIGITNWDQVRYQKEIK